MRIASAFSIAVVSISLNLQVIAVDESKAPSSASKFDLSASEIQSYSKSAFGGTDPKAGFRLFQYFAITRNSREEALKWLRLSATQGYIDAEYSLGVILVDSEETKKEGMEWLKRASDKGDARAKNLLKLERASDKH